MSAIVNQAYSERMATSKEQFGTMLPVEVPTHYSGSLEFHSGAVINLSISFDVHAHSHYNIELYGTDGSMKVPDPNGFGGKVEVFTPAAKDWHSAPYSHGYQENMR